MARPQGAGVVLSAETNGGACHDSTRPYRSGSINDLRTASPSHGNQRVKVGAIGLASVLLLIAIAATIFGAVARERPMTAPGGAKQEIVANMAGSNEAAASAALSDMGVAPGIGNSGAANR